MLLVDAVTARLQALVPTHLRRVEGAADMMALMKANALPQMTPAAHVVPSGLRGGQRRDAAGLYVQDYDEVVGVTVTLRGNDPEGKRALARVSEIVGAVVGAVAGWGPDGAAGDFALTRGTTLRMDAEAMVYLLEFSIPLQLRITQ